MIGSGSVVGAQKRCYCGCVNSVGSIPAAVCGDGAGRYASAELKDCVLVHRCDLAQCAS